jgi:rubrerythrin
MDVRKTYEYVLEREREGKRFFEENADRMSHAAATGIFRTLAEEEQRHIDFILSLIEAFDGGAKADAGLASELERSGRFLERASAESLDQTIVESMVPDLSILRVAYLIERDFAEFYEMAASRTGGEAKEALTMLARWERDHERLFKALHDRAFETYSGMPWGG